MNGLPVYNYQKIQSIAQFLKSKTNIVPKIGIICGSGLGGLADQIESPVIIKYEQIPDFPRSTGKLIQLIFLDNQSCDSPAQFLDTTVVWCSDTWPTSRLSV